MIVRQSKNTFIRTTEKYGYITNQLTWHDRSNNITILIYCRRFKDEQHKELARQVIAYYAEEQEAIKWIQSTGDSRAPKTIQTELRDRAAKNDRGNGERPGYTPNRVSKFL